jgi:hypothetical protein
MNAGVVIFAGICKSSYSKFTTKLVSTKTCLERYATIPNTADIEIEGQRQKD